MSVWILTDEWVQDFEHGCSTLVFGSLKKAQEYMAEVKAQIDEWQDYDEEEYDEMSYEGWSQNDYNNYHTKITIEQQEIR